MLLFYFLVLVTLTLFFFYYYLTLSHNNYWRKQEIPTPEKGLPLIGNMWKVLTMKESYTNLCERLYEKGSKHSMIGFYQMTSPNLLIRDPKLIKEVLLTNFSSFQDNYLKFDPELDPFMVKTAFFSRSDTWKKNRIIQAQGFSTSKVKLMFPLILDVSLKLKKYLDNQFDPQNGPIEFELKNLFNKYTSELVMIVGMGLEGFCFEENQKTFGKVVTSVFDNYLFNGGVYPMILCFFPRLAKFMKLQTVSREIELFIRQVVKDLIESKKKDEVKIRNNYLDMMLQIEMKNTIEEEEFDEENILTFYVLFFILNIHNLMRTVLSIFAFYIATSSEVQEKAREEINSVLLKFKGKWEFDAFNDLIFLDQVLYESIRLIPEMGTMIKTCTSETQLMGSDGLSCRVFPGDTIVLSLDGLQKDPRYWTKPEKFDPERFSEEKIKDINKFMFLPFGGGPRKCLGMKLAIIMMKVGIVTILKDYSLEIVPGTRLPLKKDPRSFFTNVQGGLNVYMRRLTRNA